MSELRRQERAAIEAVATHFSATWEKGRGNSPDAYVTIGGKRIAVEVTEIKQRSAERDGLTKPRLRFDRVVLSTIGRLQAALGGSVPEGQAVIVTITAPIKLAAKTAAALEGMIGVRLARRSARVEVKETIHGNQVRVRLLKGVPRGTSKVIGFVHNPDSDSEILLRLTQSLLEALGVVVGRARPKKFAGDRWLIIANEGGLPHVETYRHIYSQFALATEFDKILMVLAGGRVETLAG